MKVAYVTPYSSDDVHAWSGSVYFIRRALEHAGCEVAPIDGLTEPFPVAARIRARVTHLLTGKIDLLDRRRALLDSYARDVSKRCAEIRPDIVLSPGTIPIAHLATDIPVTFWTDATFAALHDYYPSFSNLSRTSIRTGNHVDEQAVRRSALGIYTSQWAADSAIHDYGADPAKITVVPFGANTDQHRTAADVTAIVDARAGTPLRLLFIGTEWDRKGGSIAIDAARVLNDRGAPATLDVVGAVPDHELPEFVRAHGFLSKRTAAGTALLDRLFREAHFLVVPTRADCTPMVFAEASSYGLPSLATRTGGVAAVVGERNGRLFDPSADGAEYAEYLAETIADPASYRDLALSAYDEYRSRLNWDVSGARVTELLARVVE